ncbi:MAG: hypothetical protein IJL42_07435 [Bacteroidales bacterium]|nr:hypothetical protein [Bacteroidales bacterium]
MDIENAELQPISGLPAATTFSGLFTIGTDANNNSVKVPLSAVVNPPYIGQNGHWYIWSMSANSYVDSGNASQGERGAAFTYADFTAAQLEALKGVGIQSSNVRYILSDDGSTVPSGTWSSSVPALVKGKYLWTRTTLTLTNGNNVTAYSIAYIANDGAKGDPGNNGVGIVRTETMYCIADNQEADVRTLEWQSSIPTVPVGKWLWTKVMLYYSNSDNYAFYTRTQRAASAYETAVAGGYTGTEQQFMALLASVANNTNVWLTEDQFNALQTKDPNVTYNIYEEVDSL